MYLFSYSFVVENISLCGQNSASFPPEDLHIGISVSHTFQVYLMHQILSKFGKSWKLPDLRFNWRGIICYSLLWLWGQYLLQLTFSSEVFFWLWPGARPLSARQKYSPRSDFSTRGMVIVKVILPSYWNWAFSWKSDSLFSSLVPQVTVFSLKSQRIIIF